jgi:hypothetical protein
MVQDDGPVGLDPRAGRLAPGWFDEGLDPTAEQTAVRLGPQEEGAAEGPGSSTGDGVPL